MPTPVGPVPPDPDDPDTWDWVNSPMTAFAGSQCGKSFLSALLCWDSCFSSSPTSCSQSQGDQSSGDTTSELFRFSLTIRTLCTSHAATGSGRICSRGPRALAKESKGC